MKKNYIYNKVKTYSVVAALAAVGTGMTTSCNDFLEMEPHNIITQDMFWNEKADVESVIMGCYSGMQASAIVSRMMIWGEFRSENVIVSGDCASNDASLERILKENITATNSYTYYGDFYNIINRCNIILKYAPQVAENDPSYTESALNQHIAEATAIRSLMYFYLIRTFGYPYGIPYTEDAYEDDSQERNIGPTDFYTVLGKIIASLEEVKNYAPVSYPQTSSDAAYFNTGRITRGAIYAMLTDMYLWNKEYQKAIDCAEYVIKLKDEEAQADKDYDYDTDFAFADGYPLIPSRYTSSKEDRYGRYFNEVFVKGNSLESIFELTYIKNTDHSYLSNTAYSDIFGNTGRSAFATCSDYIGNDELSATYNVFRNGLDIRGYQTFNCKAKLPVYVTKNCTSSEISLLATKSYTTSSTPASDNDFFSNSSWGTRYDVYSENNYNYHALNRANVILYRLSDIMLLEAEAYSQLIQEEDNSLTDSTDIEYCNKAFNLVKAVNDRSLIRKKATETTGALAAATKPTKQWITELVMDERERELMFEGKRYYDLVRYTMRQLDKDAVNCTSYLSEHCANKSTDLKSAIQSKMGRVEAIFWPFNNDEIKANSALEKYQNPAFNSGEDNSTSIN